MSSIPQNTDNNNVLDFVTNFIKEFHISKLLLLRQLKLPIISIRTAECMQVVFD